MLREKSLDFFREPQKKISDYKHTLHINSGLMYSTTRKSDIYLYLSAVSYGIQSFDKGKEYLKRAYNMNPKLLNAGNTSFVNTFLEVASNPRVVRNQKRYLDDVFNNLPLGGYKPCKNKKLILSRLAMKRSSIQI